MRFLWQYPQTFRPTPLRGVARFKRQADIQMSHLQVTFAVLAATAATPAADSIPPEAQCVISSVHAAAAKRDLAALKALMLDEFTWSFGGDVDAEQAIQAWRDTPELLEQLQRATSLRCAYVDQSHIQCPSNARMSYRAGFVETPEGWRMAYFVTGD